MRVSMTMVKGPREIYIIPESVADRELLDKLFSAGFAATVDDQSFAPRKAGYQRYGIKIETISPGLSYVREQAIMPPPTIRLERKYYCARCDAEVGLGQPSCQGCRALLR